MKPDNDGIPVIKVQLSELSPEEVNDRKELFIADFAANIFRSALARLSTANFSGDFQEWREQHDAKVAHRIARAAEAILREEMQQAE